MQQINYRHTVLRKQKSFEVGFSLVLKLLKPFIQRRPRQGLTSKIVQKTKNKALIPLCYQYFLKSENVGMKYVRAYIKI